MKTWLKRTGWRRAILAAALLILPIAAFAAHAAGCCPLCIAGCCPFC